MPAVPGIVMHDARGAIDPGRTPGELQCGTGLVDRAPDVLHLAVLPQSLAQRRTIIGRMRLGTQHRNRRLAVGTADGLRRRLARHARAKDQMVECMLHDRLRDGTASNT